MAITHALVATGSPLVAATDWNDAHVVTAADIPIVDAAADFDATEVEGALAELQADAEAHVAAADPHPSYRLESVAIAAADVAADVATQAELDAHAAAADPHTGYVKENDASWTELTGAGQTSLHSHAGGGNPLDAWPVGSVFIAVVSTSPATLLGGGTWVAIAAGRMLIGLDSGDAAMDTPEETGGAKTHTLTTAEMPAHFHGQVAPTSASGGAVKLAVDTNASGTQAAALNTSSVGSSGAHNNLPPFFVVYMWKRTA